MVSHGVTLTWTSVSSVPASHVTFCLTTYAILSGGRRKHLAHRVSAARGSFPKCGQVHEPYFQPGKTWFQHVPSACSTCSDDFLKYIASCRQILWSYPMHVILGTDATTFPVLRNQGKMKSTGYQYKSVQSMWRSESVLKSSKIRCLHRSQLIQIQHLAAARQETWRSSLHQPKLTRM